VGKLSTLSPIAAPSNLSDPDGFSLVLGGPTFQLWRKTHLAGDALQLLRRRIIVLALLAWLPLLLLSIVEGHAWGGNSRVTFLGDVEMHARLLVAVPLLIFAELLVHQRIHCLVAQFVVRGLIPDTARIQFNAAIASATQLRNSVASELLLLGLVYGVGVFFFIWRTQTTLDVSSWHGVSVNGKFQPSLAGWWMVCVSLPLFQFLLLRWYFRLFIWARFLWQVSRIELRLLPTHPDRCGGLGFLSAVSSTFAPILLAQGVLLAGLMADRIFYVGAKLLEFKVELIGLVALMVFAVLGPLLAFSPGLKAAKSLGLREISGLAERYSQEFERKWLHGEAAVDEPLLGSADIQSLADLGTSFEVVADMKIAPFATRTVLQLALITLAPVVPLLLTIMPLEQLLERMLKLVF
jgi:hypothetical protein